MAATYLTEKQLKRRHFGRRLKIYLAIAVLILLIIGALYIVIYTPTFQIKNFEISVSGERPASPKLQRGEYEIADTKIINTLETNIIKTSRLGWFLGPQNILVWVNAQETAESLKNLYSQISDVKIENDYFQRKIKISISTRERFGVWCLKEICFWFDRNGVIFEKAPYIEGVLINRVNDFSERELKVGDTVLRPNLVANLLKIFDLLKKAEIQRSSLKMENLDFEEMISEPLDAGPKIYFSLRIDPDFALKPLEYLKNQGWDKLEYIDFRVANRVYYK